MQTANPVDPPLKFSEHDISLEKYITKILSDYGVTNSRLNDDQNQKIELSAANLREQLHRHVVANAGEATLTRDLYEAKLAKVSAKLEVYIAYHKEIHVLLKGEIRRAHETIKALAIAIQVHLRQHQSQKIARSKSKKNLKKPAK